MSVFGILSNQITGEVGAIKGWKYDFKRNYLFIYGSNGTGSLELNCSSSFPAGNEDDSVCSTCRKWAVYIYIYIYIYIYMRLYISAM